MPTNPASPARHPLCPLTQFTWSLDLSGQNGNAPPWQGGVSESPAGLHVAGGIGGLLAMLDTKNNQESWDDVQHIYFHDANGNVGQVINVRAGSAFYGQAVARYEYYPFGGVLTFAIINGSSGQKNPFQFSTKYRDSETGLYYYGERYLLPRLGRWLNRDPIGEAGNAHLYQVTNNAPVSRVDPLGLCPWPWPGEEECETENQPPQLRPTGPPHRSLCDDGWEPFEGHGVADQKSGTAWLIDRVSSNDGTWWARWTRTSTYWRDVGLKVVGGCGQKLAGSFSVTLTESTNDGWGIGAGIKLWRLSGQGSYSRSSSTGESHSVTQAFGPYQDCRYRYMAILVGEWRDYFKTETSGFTNGTRYLTFPPSMSPTPPPDSDWSGFVIGGYTGAFGTLICRQQCDSAAGRP